ncbi:MAG: hypothetical protein V1809_02410 [Planctomycetota bacterium]
MDKSFEALNRNIPFGLEHKYAFIIQDDIKSRFSGFKRQDPPSSGYDNILFVTTPIQSFHNQIVVIHVTFSPEQTRVVSIDGECQTKIWYSQFPVGNGVVVDLEGEKTDLGAIINVRSENPGVLILEELEWPGSRYAGSDQPPRTPRFFQIHASGDVLKISQVEAPKAE